MALACLLNAYEDEIICDLAETYGIMNYEKEPPGLIAVLVIGLREDSRLKIALSGNKASQRDIMQAAIFDKLSFIAWAQTKAAYNGGTPPDPIAKKLCKEVEKENETTVYTSPAEFELARIRILEKINGQED